jgi:pyruvate dehydrogenase E1 component
MPAMPEGVDVAGLLKGMYRYAEGPQLDDAPKAQLLASGIAVPWALKAQRLLAEEWNVSADVWSVTSWSELRRDALESEKETLISPDAPPRTPYVTEALTGTAGPVVAVSDFMRAVQDQIARWVPGDYVSLGTDGFGRSDTREALRRFFETDTGNVVVAVLSALAARGEATAEEVAKAIRHYGIDADAPDPRVS